MNAFLTAPTAEGFRQLRKDPKAKHQALTDAWQLAGILKTMFHAIEPVAMLALAQKWHPDATPGEAVKLALSGVREAAANIKGYQDAHKAVSDAELARLAPAMSRATRRVFAITAQIEAMQTEKARSVGGIEHKRTMMSKAGVPQADIERLNPAFDEAAFGAEIQVLKAEQAALEAFLASGDESLLPEGFILAESLKFVVAELPAAQ